MDTRLESRWYAPILSPVFPTVRRAIESLEPPDDPFSRPRVGLGGALVIHVARGFGARRFRRAGRVAVAALEGYNQSVHASAVPDGAERARWLAKDMDWARDAWERILSRDDHLLARVMDRLLGDGATSVDRPIPETVLFLRAAVAAGVVVGDVPDEVHARLDRFATWVGLASEARAGELSADGWEGALGAVGLGEPLPSDPGEFAWGKAPSALDGLPEGAVVPLLRSALGPLAQRAAEPSLPRRASAWEPCESPDPPAMPRAWSGSASSCSLGAIAASPGVASRGVDTPAASSSAASSSAASSSAASSSAASSSAASSSAASSSAASSSAASSSAASSSAASSGELPTGASSTDAPGPGLAAFDELGDAFRASLAEELRRFAGSDSVALTRATTYLLEQGGKRVRPLLALAAAQSLGGDARRALPIAAAIEWLHQASLVLDDIVDDAAVRRGVPPLHAATSEPFAAGVAVFVLSRVLRRLHAAHPQIREQLVRAATALAAGERLELVHTGDPRLSVTEYYRIIEAKTARVFRAAAAAGALSVEARRGEVRCLARYGGELGLGFQIVDDLLDYDGEEATLGKRPGTDLVAQKVTLPYLLLDQRLERAGDGASRERLRAALGRASELDWVTAAMRAHEVPGACRERARLHLGRAAAALAELPPPPDASAVSGRAALEALTAQLADRVR